MSDGIAVRTASSLAGAIRFVARHPLAFAVGLVLAVFLSAGLHFLEGREKAAGEHRFVVRANLTAGFVASYVRDLAEDQRAAARAYSTADEIGYADMKRIVEANRFSSAVLLDSSGRVRAAHPVKPGLIGARLSTRYWHLGRALAGQDTVSNVVSSAAERLPVVAIATAVETPGGRRVFSTAYEVISSPLTAYLASALPMGEDDAYLVDGRGAIVASKRREARVASMSARDGALAAAVRERSSGFYSDGGEKRFFVVRQVAGTPWRFVATRPVAAVRPSWLGQREWVSAAVTGAVGGAALLVCALLAGLLETRARLLRDVARREHVEAELVRERALLAHRASHDPLTGLANRALLFERMETAHAHGAEDPHRRAAVLFIDLDGFKSVNDNHGHEVGDRVLNAVADRLREAVRPTDTVARLGGDEFAILCDPLTTSESARAIAERVRTFIERPIAIDGGATVRVGASVGIAEHPTSAGDPHRLLADADAAMYAAKVARRGRRKPTAARVAA